MNVLFIEKKLRTDKMGIMYISAMLVQAGHSVYMVQDDIDSAEQYMKDNPVDVVCWSMMTSDAPWMFSKNKDLKSKFKFISIVGGQHPTFFPEEATNDPDVDFVVIGPGELLINDILSGKITQKTTRGQIPDVDTLPFPYRDIQYRYDEFGKARVKRFMCGRYCFYNCTYCFNNKIKKTFKDQIPKMWKRHDVGLTMQEIDEVKAKYGMEHANFNDDNIAADREWLVEFCTEMEKRHLEWSGLVCANSVDLELLKLMQKSGCEFLFMGVESANRETQKLLHRQWVTNEEIAQAMAWCKEVGIRVRTANIIGFPVEDPLGDALETLQFNLENRPADSIVAVFQPYKGTVIWDYCYKMGLLDEATNGGTYYGGTKLKIRDADKINNLFNWWPIAIRHQLPLDLVKILTDLPVPPEIAERIHDYRWELDRKSFYKL